ncbi:tRNA uridine-5-carboxymethylaminomethyl(34) synthesis GTPase MnmE [Cohnella hashimotonis]|uniref:tRNA modification GTPase MnmE n=1 Tax=Cohnella hashimotonis TaxID=2826895 RepID=A0ABT6TRI9_9BACL|nr:tRNA uridine-5-carboxymethylaminomethyl(34) synthesis GTPase MnmE [Cohnella hashimotonis]MDI4649459.1 tRNA uridine-5-carboxymethylaminomethyl(34) synthesis GTPase MnmE [Cohnella hashimotonis]
MNEDTIAAIATALGEGSIAVVRVSGAEAIGKVAPLFKSKEDLREVESHTVHYGWIKDPDSGSVMDEVLVTVMKGPRSFTAEDVVEISTHGGIVAVQSVLELLLRSGIRMAEPGEFTKRAFLNGRIDLAQAEAVIDLIRSKSSKAFQVARKQAEGALSKRLVPLKEQLIELLAHVEVNIDYPEHDVAEVTGGVIRDHCGAVLRQVETLLKTAAEGKILREGIVTAIVGRPNAGKSSLLNALVKENRAIVTDIPGTTRDIVEESVTLSGIPLRLLDTAGIRETEDVVERIGVERSRGALGDADLILLVLSRSDALHEEERRLLEELKDRPTIVILNKSDLELRLEEEEVRSLYPSERIVSLSAKEGLGMEALERAVSKLFMSGGIESSDATYVSNVRHISLLHASARSLQDAIDGAEQGLPVDLIQIDIAAAWESLGEIVGDTASESLLDQIFSKFCLGK